MFGFFFCFFLAWSIVARADDDSCLLHVLNIHSSLCETSAVFLGGVLSSSLPSCAEQFIWNKWCIPGKKLSLLFSQHPSVALWIKKADYSHLALTHARLQHVIAHCASSCRGKIQNVSQVAHRLSAELPRRHLTGLGLLSARSASLTPWFFRQLELDPSVRQGWESLTSGNSQENKPKRALPNVLLKPTQSHWLFITVCCSLSWFLLWNSIFSCGSHSYV